jgi:hypothetical protein
LPHGGGPLPRRDLRPRRGHGGLVGGAPAAAHRHRTSPASARGN